MIGVLSALPFIGAGNLCCCLWVVSGGLVASYLLQQNQAAPIDAGDGALVGFLAGMSGAVIYLVLSIPITILITPMQRALIERALHTTPEVPAEFGDFMASVGPAVWIAVGFMFMLCVGAIFSTLGGLLGVALFKRQPPAGSIDVPASS